MVSSISKSMRAVGTFNHRDDAEKGLNELRNSGFSMDSVSILAQNKDSNEIAGAEVKDRGDSESTEGAGIGAVTGTVLGGLGGLLVGLEALIIPGVGPFLAAGTIATTLAGAGIGAASGALVGALTGAGIPEEDAQAYSDRISQGDYIVILEGQEDEIERAGSILKRHNIGNWKTYNISNSSGYNRNDSYVENRNTQSYVDRTDIDDDTVVQIVDKRDTNRLS
ncbi:multi-sensor signal transduction histidine kinase [Calothrix sp. NIES-4071]|nr:multi-sensor signal transduction histidine kinase [Calothrix sp. NIES-4071]BAZ55168.1 multi-sensor signal transduction histidine kinase [Calothrix sp. NIES-4105]